MCPQTSLKFLANLWVLCASLGSPVGLVGGGGGSCQLLCLLILSRAWTVEGAQLAKSWPAPCGPVLELLCASGTWITQEDLLACSCLVSTQVQERDHRW